MKVILQNLPRDKHLLEARWRSTGAALETHSWCKPGEPQPFTCKRCYHVHMPACEQGVCMSIVERFVAA